MTEELKPCPFCGYRARVEATRDAVGDYQGYVECMDCGATVYGPGDMKDAESAMYEAGRAWNRRYAERERSANVRRWRCRSRGRDRGEPRALQREAPRMVPRAQARDKGPRGDAQAPRRIRGVAERIVDAARKRASKHDPQPYMVCDANHR
ncbi:Lar family restriction alleviation protein [Collinsella intestinalis]|nr:Lar family restriction alleviation protein [Collinsella intestinalis]MBM6943404.1 Lar family restriction alleviation protein [Collinsella intestinalis]